MDIEFRTIKEFPRGTLCDLLRDGYSFEPRFERDWLNEWHKFDDFFYDNPHIADFSGFMTVRENIPIGFVTWDPRLLPASAEIGHNCIAARHKGNGYGRRQMQEAVRRIMAQGAQKIVVTTNEILVAAQRTYEAAGFKFIGKSVELFCPEYAGMRINYELVRRIDI